MKKKLILFIGLFLVLALFLTGVGVAINTQNDGFRLYASSTMQVFYGTTCYQLVNNHGSDFFIPTKTSAELSSFSTNKPGTISLTPCSSLPPRVSLWCGKVNSYTDANGIWQTSPDCGNTYDCNTNPRFQCGYVGHPSATTQAVGIEYITKWTDRGCSGGPYTSAQQTYECLGCSDIGDSTTCTNANCYWHIWGYQCDSSPCYSYSTSTTCGNAGCYWNGWNCVNVPSCNYYSEEMDCFNDGNCGWDYSSYCCYDAYSGSCSNWQSQYECDNYGYGCQWDSYGGVCHTAC